MAVCPFLPCLLRSLRDSSFVHFHGLPQNSSFGKNGFGFQTFRIKKDSTFFKFKFRRQVQKWVVDGQASRVGRLGTVEGDTQEEFLSCYCAFPTLAFLTTRV